MSSINFKYIVLIFVLCLTNSLYSQTIKGLSLVGPPEPYTVSPITKIKKIGSNWISVIPFAHTPRNMPNVYYNKVSWRWWGESKAGVREAIRLAHQKGIKVMLKPQLYVPGDWPGGIDFDNEEDWLQFEKEYRQYIFQFVLMATEMNVSMICIATELKISVQKREKFWRQLIKDIRKVYHGQLTYAANWDNYTKIPFWDALDFIGIDAYFPICDAQTPTKRQLKAAWQPTKNKLKFLSKKYNKKIIFTEFGYLSVDQCAYKTWLLEKDVKKRVINELAQANAYDALYDSFWYEKYWAGGFLWKWFPNMKGHEGYPERDYTPQGKLSEEIIAKWFKLD